MTGLLRFLAGPEAAALREAWRSDPGSPPPDPVRVVEALRARLPAERARALADQILLERRAVRKFPDPRRFLFERTALEQATSPGCAAWHAASAPAGAAVVDGGCGLGADTIAFERAGHRVVAVERDPWRAALAAHNLGAAGGGRGIVVRGEAGRLPARGDVLFVDPDRRPAGRRSVRLADASPSWGDIAAWRGRFDRLRVKAPPAIPEDDIPPEAAVEFLSEEGECKEAFLRLGADEAPGRRVAVLVDTGEVWPAESAPMRIAEGGAFLLDPDPALRRAGGVDGLAASLGAGRAAPESTYLFADRAPSSPWVRAYPVLDVFAYRPRELARRLAADPPRELLVKQRGLHLPEAAVRRGLPHRESGPTRVVVLFPRGRSRVACLCGPADPR